LLPSLKAGILHFFFRIGLQAKIHMNILLVILQVLSIIGALVLFLYGMKIMSESLQKIAGQSLRRVLAKITSKPVKGILTGFTITSLIQSSSASTVMVVSFVNAGLLSFTESIGVVFGANIGTTVTAWLISILGFGSHFSLYSIMLPMVAFALPLFFSYKTKNKARAEFIIGFALLFIGIYFFKENIPVIDENSDFLKGLRFFDNSFLHILMFIGVGILITIIFQTSSATITLTMVLAAQGWLSFEAALAMVLGENIGTTATANVAAIVGNRSAKRTALAHLLFNLLGMIWVLPLFALISGSLQNILANFFDNPDNITAFGISIFHTSFNLINAIILTLFFNPFRQLCFRLLPNGIGANEVYTLKYIDSALLSTSELAILQARKEIAFMGKQVVSIFMMVPELLLEKKEKKFARIFNKILNGEKMIDEMEVEIAGYITKISEDDLSDHGRMRLKAMLKIIDYLETISDLTYQMALTITKKKEANAWFTQELRNNLRKEFNLIEKSMNLMVSNLEQDYFDIEIADAQQIENEINQTSTALKQAYLEEINREKLPYKTGIYYNDLVGLAEKIGNCIYDVNRAMYLKKKSKDNKITNQKK
jgi:phosphate:Na+ symporter